jgi:hypothetical protein
VQAFDLLSDLEIFGTAAVAGPSFRKTCATDPSTGAFCATQLGADYQFPDVSASISAATALATLSQFSNVPAALCSACGLSDVNMIASIARSLFGFYEMVGGIAAITAVAPYDATAAANATSDLAAVTFAVGLPEIVQPLCGLMPSGQTCVSQAVGSGAFANTSSALGVLIGLAPCLPALASGGTCASAVGCAAALSAAVAPYGCCFPTFVSLIAEDPTISVLIQEALHTSLNATTMAMFAANCSNPSVSFTACTAPSVGHLSFRLLNLNGTALQLYASGAQLAAIEAAIVAQLAFAINADVSQLTVASLAPGAGGTTIVTLTLTASSATTLSATIGQAVSAASSGALTFPTVAEAAAAVPGALVSGSASVSADASYGVTPTPSPSSAARMGSLGAAAATLVAVAAAALLL